MKKYNIYLLILIIITILFIYKCYIFNNILKKSGSLETFENTITIKNIPIIINNFENLYSLRPLINNFYKKGYRNIIVIDNNSTYKPLLDYYKSTLCKEKCKVILLKKNYKHTAIWDCSKFNNIFKNWYVYTDPDLDITTVPDTFILDFINIHKKFNLDKTKKIGCALKINDLPDIYKYKQDVINWENKFWEKKIYSNKKYILYDASIDTTLAVYPPNFNKYQINGYRVAGKYTIKHIPWYFDHNNLSENVLYYISKTQSGYWFKKENVETLKDFIKKKNNI